MTSSLSLSLNESIWLWATTCFHFCRSYTIEKLFFSALTFSSTCLFPMLTFFCKIEQEAMTHAALEVPAYYSFDWVSPLSSLSLCYWILHHSTAVGCCFPACRCTYQIPFFSHRSLSPSLALSLFSSLLSALAGSMLVVFCHFSFFNFQTTDNCEGCKWLLHPPWPSVQLFSHDTCERRRKHLCAMAFPC